MLDIKYLEQNFDTVQNNLKNRNFDKALLSAIKELNQERVALTQKVEVARAEANKLSKTIGAEKAKGNPAADLMAKVGEIKSEIKSSEERLEKIQSEILDKALRIPNMIHEEVPQGTDESMNKEIFSWGKEPSFDFKVRDHVDLGESLGLLDFEAATKMTGSRFFVLKGGLARLERALINFFIDQHLQAGYLEIVPPLIVNAQSLIGTGNLPKFEEDLFKLTDERGWFLIPTAEVPLTNLKREQVFSAKEFPLKYVAYTPCFRSEAGSYGKDTRGLIRLHQFNKVEMVNITHPSESEKAHQDMINQARKLLELLKLPYRGLLLCSGDMGFSANKCVDLEVWLPSANKYREISSISNCTDFQARRASIRFKDGDSKPQFAHTLNGSGLAVGRTLIAIMENYQTKEGRIRVPDVLKPYMGNAELI
jgi:seryl-tRNA synthetase